MTQLLNSKNILLSVALVATLLIVACGTGQTVQTVKIPDKELETKYNASLQTWEKEKVAHNNSYEYEVSYVSWVGYSATTTITVKNGKVVGRTFAERQPDDKTRFTEDEILVYTETEADINTNEKGEPGRTLDQVYKTCGETTLQVNGEENYVSFTTNELGLLRICNYADKRCSDDCSKGINIERFRWVK